MADAAVSRRRILQGAAWATPAVLIATAAPAAAASPPVAGTMTFLTASAAMSTAQLFVHAQLAYAGDGAPSPDLAVDTITVSIEVPNARLGAGLPTASGGSWTYTSSLMGPTTTVFTFTWGGPDLDSSNPVLAELVATFPKTTDNSTITGINLAASGFSNGNPATASAGPVSALLIGELALNDSAGIAFNPGLNTPSGNVAAYVISGTLRWNGPYTPPGGPVSGVTVRVRVASTHSTGARYDTYPGSVGANWVLSQAPTLVGSDWVLVYSYSGVLTEGTPSTTVLVFGVEAIGGSVPGAVEVTVTSVSQGHTTSRSGTGP